MVAASSPFGISKAALERRVNNQIPRKRHTPYPVTKNVNRVMTKHVTLPKTKSTPSRINGKRESQIRSPIRPEKRGTNRTRTAGTGSNVINQWPARRILASRRHPTNPWKTQYKIQWETTWEDSRDITGLAFTEWEEAVKDDGTFEFNSQDGSQWTVLKDNTCLENDSEDSQWELWRAIRRNAVQELEKDIFAQLADEDIVFASEKEKMQVQDFLRDKWPEERISARNVLRAAWTQMNDDPEMLETDVPLGGIKIRFVAQLDPWIVSDDGNESFDQDRRMACTVTDVVQGLIPNPLGDLDDEAFSKGHAHRNFSRWCKILKLTIRKIPFMFKSGTWLQLFALLLMGSDGFREELASIGITVQDNWCQRAREYNMHMYYDQIVDNRSTHDIQETFLNVRDFFRELEPEQEVSVDSTKDDSITMESKPSGGA